MEEYGDQNGQDNFEFNLTSTKELCSWWHCCHCVLYSPMWILVDGANLGKIFLTKIDLYFLCKYKLKPTNLRALWSLTTWKCKGLLAKIIFALTNRRLFKYSVILCCFELLIALCINIVLHCNVYLPCTIRGRGVRVVMLYWMYFVIPLLETGWSMGLISR